MPDKPNTTSTLDYATGPRRPRDWRGRVQWFLHEYSWFLVKNILGWTLMLAAWPLGFLLPGPGGIPLFLIGFALVTFPGKRRLTARVLRGRRLSLDALLYTWTAIGTAAALAVATLWILTHRYPAALAASPGRRAVSVGLALAAMLFYWLATGVALRATNILLGNVPRLRRLVRPWMRRRGINLLPPRRRKRAKLQYATVPGPGQLVAEAVEIAHDEIIEIHERHWERARRFGRWLRRWGWLLGFGAAALLALLVLVKVR
jgi:hypothetical protein